MFQLYFWIKCVELILIVWFSSKMFINSLIVHVLKRKNGDFWVDNLQVVFLSVSQKIQNKNYWALHRKWTRFRNNVLTIWGHKYLKISTDCWVNLRWHAIRWKFRPNIELTSDHSWLQSIVGMNSGWKKSTKYDSQTKGCCDFLRWSYSAKNDHSLQLTRFAAIKIINRVGHQHVAMLSSVWLWQFKTLRHIKECVIIRLWFEKSS